MATKKELRRLKIKTSIRKKISGTAERPRLSVFRSNVNISVQIIDDVRGITLESVSSLQSEIASKKLTKTEQSKLVGKMIAERALSKGIDKVVFDRNGYIYHGRIKSLAESAREAGLNF